MKISLADLFFKLFQLTCDAIQVKNIFNAGFLLLWMYVATKEYDTTNN